MIRHVPFILFLIAVVGSIGSCIYEDKAKNHGLPLVQGALVHPARICIPPASHWQFKQRNIA